jgi:hypothetical protein
MITNDASCTCEIKSKITMEKQHSTKRRLSSPTKLTEVWEETSEKLNLEHGFL